MGQYAIAHVILNRVADKSFPDNVCDVVYWAESDSEGKPIRNRCSFSFTCDGIADTIRNGEAYARAVEIALDVTLNRTPDATDGALWFHATYVNPGWNYYHTITVYNHRFFTRRFQRVE
jgi:spore germination cell wall hydrolase CwlJ-like protein